MRVTALVQPCHRPFAAALVAVAVAMCLSPGQVVAANALTAPQVTPTIGTTLTDFVFSVHYQSANGNAPKSVSVIVGGGAPRALGLISGSAGNGTYALTTTLPAGADLSVSFVADAAQGPDPTAVDGPTLQVTQGPTPQATPTPLPTPTPTATPRPTASPRATATPAPTPRPPTPRPGDPTPQPSPTQPAMPGPRATAASTATASPPRPAGSASPTAESSTDETPSPSSSEPSSGQATADEASEAPAASGEPGSSGGREMGRIALILVGGTLSASGAGYLGLLALRRRAKLRG